MKLLQRSVSIKSILSVTDTITVSGGWWTSGRIVGVREQANLRSAIPESNLTLSSHAMCLLERFNVPVIDLAGGRFDVKR